AIARPRGTPIVPINQSEARRNVVIMVDTSWSTNYQTGSDARQTVHEREQRAAKEIIRQLREVDRVSIVAFNEQARNFYKMKTVGKDQDKIVDAIESAAEMQVSSRGTNYIAAFSILPEVLDDFDTEPGKP